MSHATQLRAVRAHFGFSQLALAPWLGLSRDLLASVESGREQLPTHARRWLWPWAEALALPEPAAAPLPSVGAAILPEALAGPAPVLARLAECHYQAQRLARQQAALLAGHRTAGRRLAAGPLLQATLPPTVVAEASALALRRRWLARLLEAAADALAPESPTGPVAATLLDARCRAWLHEAACLRAGLVEAGSSVSPAK